MISALLTGYLVETPKPGVTNSGKPYVTARVLVTTNTNRERTSVSVIAFNDRTAAGLLELEAGDTVSLAGEITPKACMDRGGNLYLSIDMQANRLLTAYDGTRKPRATDNRGA